MKYLIAFILAFIGLNSYCQNTVDPDVLVKAFKQGKRGNCASIALIKSSIALIKSSINVFGINNVFQESSINDTLFKIILKNEDSLELSTREIISAQKAADFILKDSSQKDLYDYAVKCYAIMGKMRERIESMTSYDHALKKLGKGAYTPTVYEFLGLEQNKKSLKRFSNITSLCGVVAWRKKHAVFSCNGYIDEHGKKQNLSMRYYGRFQIIP